MKIVIEDALKVVTKPLKINMLKIVQEAVLHNALRPYNMRILLLINVLFIALLLPYITLILLLQIKVVQQNAQLTFLLIIPQVPVYVLGYAQ